MTQRSVRPANPEAAQEGKDASLTQADGCQSRRIFYFVDSLNVGGTEVQAVELAIRMAARGHRVTLGCLRAQGPLLERLEGSVVNVEEFYPRGGIDSAGGLYQLFRLIWHLHKSGYDIVHTHDLWSNLLGISAARLAGVPVIVSSRRDLGHLDWYEGKRRVWLRRIQNLSQIVLANATPIRDALISEDGFPANKVRVIHNGIDPKKFQCAGNRQVLFPQAGVGKLIVLVGNMHSGVKGHSWLIACAPAVIAEFPSTRFVLVGDGEQRKKYESEVQQSGVSENFIFLGLRNDVPEILACCDIAVLPSLAEGLPNAVLEYMATGLPCVVSSVGGSAELVDEGVTGILVPARDSNALSRALLKLLGDPSSAQRMGKKGQHFVEHNFSFEQMVRRVEELYADLLQNYARAS
jgi:glycosyltransferase involved in cell wall biosynthesis